MIAMTGVMRATQRQSLSLRALQGRGNLLNNMQSVLYEKRLLLYDRNDRTIHESFIK